MRQLRCLLLLLFFCTQLHADQATDELLAACGQAMDGVIDNSEFTRFYKRNQLSFKDLGEEFGLSAEELLRSLTMVWFGYKSERLTTGIDHVLCGDFHTKKIGGLHWKARYDQLRRSLFLINEKSLSSDFKEVFVVSYEADPKMAEAKKSVGSMPLDQGVIDTLSLGFRSVRNCCYDDQSDYTTLWIDGLTRVKAILYKGSYKYYNKVICGFKDGAPYLVTMYPLGTNPKYDDHIDRCD